jgi:hypothetical protein
MIDVFRLFISTQARHSAIKIKEKRLRLIINLTKLWEEEKEYIYT